MVLYPNIQAQAQAEIDDVIGNNRLPTIEDRERLPFLSALVTEALRWHTVGPISIPHRVMEDDIHDGYLIPKGAIILPNIWFVPRFLVIRRSDLKQSEWFAGRWLTTLAFIKILWSLNPHGSSRPKVTNRNLTRGKYPLDLGGGISVLT